MSQAKLKLIIDKKREEAEELGAYDSLYEMYTEQAKERRDASLWGKVIGGILGYATGGMATAVLYSSIASELGKWGVQLNDEQQVLDMLAKDTFKGGKFDAQDLQQSVKEEKEWAASRQDAYLYDTVMQAVLTGTTIKGLGTEQTFGDMLLSKGDSGTWSQLWQKELPALLSQGIDSPLGKIGKQALASYSIERAPETRDPEEAVNQAALAVLGSYFTPGG